MARNWAALKGRAEGYRSGLEDVVAKQIASHGIAVQYELFPLYYVIPERTTFYKCDFILPNGILIETKGEFTSADRKKHLLIQKQHPDLDIRFVFSRSSSKIGKKSTTSYAMWCNRAGFLFADKRIPLEWLDEAPCAKRIKAAQKILGWSPPSS